MYPCRSSANRFNYAPGSARHSLQELGVAQKFDLDQNPRVKRVLEMLELRLKFKKDSDRISPSYMRDVDYANRLLFFLTSGTGNLTNLLQMDRLYEYVGIVKRYCTGSTIRLHLTGLVNLLETIACNPEMLKELGNTLQEQMNISLYIKNVALVEIKDMIRCCAREDAHRARSRKAKELRETGDTRVRFREMVNLCSDLLKHAQNVRDLLEGNGRDSLSSYHCIQFQNYLCGVVCLLRGHRPGVAQNMTITEFEDAQKTGLVDGFFCVVVERHKTEMAGPAYVFLTPFEFEMFTLYLSEIRPVVRSYAENNPVGNNTVDQDLFLISLTGRRVPWSQRLRRFQEQQAVVKSTLPFRTVRDARKALENENASQNFGNPSLRKDIAGLISHSEKTAERAYRQPSIQSRLTSAKWAVGLSKSLYKNIKH